MLPRIPCCCCVKLMGADSFAAVSQWEFASETKRITLVLFSSVVGFWSSLVSGKLSWEFLAEVRQLGVRVALKPCKTSHPAP